MAMEIQVFCGNDDLPLHLKWQILSFIRIEWHESAGDYVGPDALPEPWNPIHVAGLEGEAIVSYAGIIRRDVTHEGAAFRLYGLSSVFTFPARRGAAAALGCRSCAAPPHGSTTRPMATSRCCSPGVASLPSTSVPAGR